MKRILITGNAGAGKTTLASQVATEIGLPYIGLDSIVWHSRWQKTPKTERIKQELLIANQDAWVVDGVSDALLEAADAVVFLDFPRFVCLYRAFLRNLPYLFRSRPGLPEGCPEILIIPSLLKIIWLFPIRVRPRILANKSKGKVIFHIQHHSDLHASGARVDHQMQASKANYNGKRKVSAQLGISGNRMGLPHVNIGRGHGNG